MRAIICDFMLNVDGHYSSNKPGEPRTLKHDAGIKICVRTKHSLVNGISDRINVMAAELCNTALIVFYRYISRFLHSIVEPSRCIARHEAQMRRHCKQHQQPIQRVLRVASTIKAENTHAFILITTQFLPDIEGRGRGSSNADIFTPYEGSMFNQSSRPCARCQVVQPAGS